VIDGNKNQPASGIALPGLTTEAIDRWLFGAKFADPDVEGLEYHQGTIPSPDDPSKGGITSAYGFWQADHRTKPDDRVWLNALDDCAKWLGEAVMADLEKGLTGGQIVIVATGALALLPLQAAWLPDFGKPGGRRYLVDSFEIRYAPSARVLIRPKQQASADSFFGVADPQSPNTHALPYATSEIGIASSTFQDKQVLEWPQAIGLAVATAMTKAAVVHLCCHAYSNFKRPSDSAVALADGDVLSLWDLVRMDFSNARLVILSACESGKITRSTADQMVSFASALLGAGARTVIATGWDINDPAASILMMRFYHSWRVQKISVAAALREAQQWMRDTTNNEKAGFCETLLPDFGGTAVFDTNAVSSIYRLLALKPPEERTYSHPHFWAAFTYSGQ
jgi:CHAT domain-containing protein